MHPTVLALKELLAATTAKAIHVVYAPTNGIASDAICLWAWRVGEDAAMRQVPSMPARQAAVPPLEVSCLVFAPDLELLDLARTAIFQAPLREGAGQRVVIRHEPLDSALLLKLFLAAKLEPRPCLNVVLKAVAA